jgi:hypothetical protein
MCTFDATSRKHRLKEGFFRHEALLRQPPDDASHSPCEDDDDECQYSSLSQAIRRRDQCSSAAVCCSTQSDVMLGRSRIGSNTTGQLDDTEIAKGASCPGR